MGMGSKCTEGFVVPGGLKLRTAKGGLGSLGLRGGGRGGITRRGLRTTGRLTTGVTRTGVMARVGIKRNKEAFNSMSDGRVTRRMGTRLGLGISGGGVRLGRTVGALKARGISMGLRPRIATRLGMIMRRRTWKSRVFVSVRTTVGQVPPRDTRTRRTILNTVLVGGRTVAITSRVLSKSSFCRATCKVLFGSVIRLFRTKGPISLVALRRCLGRGSIPPRVDDVRFTESLLVKARASTGVGDCTRVMHRGSVVHHLVGMGRRATGTYCLRGRPLRRVLRSTRGRIFTLTRAKGSRRCMPVGRIMLGTLSMVRHTSGAGKAMAKVPAKFVSLSCGLSNLRHSSLMLVTTHPSVNGATFMLGVTRRITFHRGGTMTVFDLRVSGRRLMGHLFSLRSRISTRVLEANGLSSAS